MVMRPYKPKTTTETKTGEKMLADEVATQAPTAETTVKISTEKASKQGWVQPTTQELLEGL